MVYRVWSLGHGLSLGLDTVHYMQSLVFQVVYWQPAVAWA